MPNLKRIAVSLALWPIITALTTFLFLVVLAVTACSLAFDKKRRLAHSQCFWWSDAVIAVNPFWRVVAQGIENIDLQRTYIIVSNHQSIADIVVLYQTKMQFKWVAKESLFRTPFIGWCMNLTKHIKFSRGKKAGIMRVYRESAKWLENGVSVLFFPEGSRSPDETLQDFHNGAFKLAISKKVAVLPIVLQGTGKAVPKGSWLVAPCADMRMTVLPAIETERFQPGEHERLKEEAKAQIGGVLSQEKAL